MIGLLRVVALSGEQEFDLPRQRVTVGSAEACEITVASEGILPAHLALDWDSKRATWLLTGATLPGAVTALNGQVVTPGLPTPLAHLDVIEVPGVFLQFQRVLDAPSRGGAPIQRIPLGDAPVTIGRADPAETTDPARVDLDAEEGSISRTHAVIEKAGLDYFLTDHSRAGMELNGLAFTRERLVFGDRFRISDYIFEFDGDGIRRILPEISGSVRARNVGFAVNLGRAGLRNILENVSLDIAAGEFIGVLGGSGQGKSTLLHSLCGINPPTAGEVRIGGVPHTDRQRLREIGIGFVPQDDIVHKELTVEEAITYSARLRLRLPRHQIDALVFRVIQRLGLGEHAKKRVADLSGGQRKRVSIAIELLAKPSVLFLDEPSSGLDPATEESLMTLLQSLTLTKLTVVCTTHVLQKAYLFDRVLFIQGGRLVFAGDADQARTHFLQQASEPSVNLANSPLERIYSLLAEPGRNSAQWEQLFQQSPAARHAFPPLPPERPGELSAGKTRALEVGPLRTLGLLAARQWRILQSDKLNLAFILAQPLLIGGLVGWVADESALRLFLCIVATMWFGCSNGAQQIVSELPIFRRERVCGQGLNAYVLSKFAFLSGISLLQAALLFFTTLICAQQFHPEKIDRENSLKDLAVRLTPPAKAGVITAAQAEDFDIVDADSAPKAAPTTAPAAAEPSSPKPPSATTIKTLSAVGQFFQITQNLIDSGPRVLTQPDGTPLRDRAGLELTLPAIPLWRVLLTTLGLRSLALAAAAIVGVGIGLTISSLVKNATQAVLWVPLVLIPQILFGGIVVSVPDMSRSVRAFSQIMPSFSAQRIVDVASIYGLATPFLTNRTKMPVFLTARGEKETVEWQSGERSFSQDYDKVSPVNASWQNLAVFPERLGQHKHAGTRTDDGFRIEYRDTVETRRDVRFVKATVFRSILPFQLALGVLAAWVAVCYVVILAGLARQQTGK